MRSVSKICQPVAVALGFSAALIVLGCGDESGLGRRYKVTGKVTYKGNPVPQGRVEFRPTKPPAPEGRAAHGEIKDGYYTLSTAGADDGALPGEYDVTFVSVDIDMSQAVAKGPLPKIHEGDAAYLKAVKSGKDLIPPKYQLAETSKLKATVTTGGPNEFNFDLTD
jgi:hypothetical protein